VVALTAGLAFDIVAIRGAGIDASAHAYGAATHVLLAWQGLHVVLLWIVTAYVLARRRAGLLGPVHRVTFDTLRLFWLYTVAQGLVTSLVLHSARLVA
jgi:cytochrome c oxidase subunit I+III